MTTVTGSSSRLARVGRSLEAMLEFAIGSHRRAAVVLVIVSLLMFLPGFFGIPPTDRDEARFAQASKQMIESGNYVDIRFQAETRYKKPVGIYWLQAGAVQSARALGMPDALTTIWLYRLPSLFGAIGAVLLTYWAALAFIPRRGAVLAALMLAGCVVLGVEARLAKTDAMLLLTVVAAMGAMARVYLSARSSEAVEPGWALPMIFWTALAAGVLLKGPLILMFVGLTAAVLWIADRSIAWVAALRPGGVVWFLVLVLPWFLAIYFTSGSSFFVGSLGHDMLTKVASGQESHGAPPGYYFAMFWLTFWPGATIAGLAVPAIWKARREQGIRFLLAWAIPSWIVFELVITKLPHYVLPLYPAIAILIAGAMERMTLSRRPTLELGLIWWLLFPLLLAGAAVAALIMYSRQLGLMAWPFAAAAVLFGFFAWRLYDRDGAERSLLRALTASVLIAITIYMIVVPSLGVAFPSATIAAVLKESGCRNPIAASAGFHEPSLVFLAGTATPLTDGAGAAEFLKSDGCRFAFVEKREQPGFIQRAQAIHLRYSAGQPIEAIDYTVGRFITIFVHRAETQQ